MILVGGIGVNIVVRDFVLFGCFLCEDGGYKVGVIECYEKEMRIYVSEVVCESYLIVVK